MVRHVRLRSALSVSTGGVGDDRWVCFRCLVQGGGALAEGLLADVVLSARLPLV